MGEKEEHFDWTPIAVHLAVRRNSYIRCSCRGEELEFKVKLTRTTETAKAESIDALVHTPKWKATKFVFARTAPRREDMPATYSNQHVILFNISLFNCFVVLTDHVSPRRRMYKYSLLESYLSSEPCSHSFHRVAPLPLSAHLRVCHMLPVSLLRSAPGRGGLECLAGLHNACSRLAPAFHAE